MSSRETKKFIWALTRWVWVINSTNFICWSRHSPQGY